MKYLRYLGNYFVSFLYDAYYFVWGDARSRIMGLRYYKESKLYPGYLKLGNMAAAVEDLARSICRGRGVDIGAGRWPLVGARAIENGPGENAYAISEENRSLDFVFSSHTLEHLERWQDALREWHRVLKAGGSLVLYLPHAACRMWATGVNRQHVWTPTTTVVADFLHTELGMSIVQKTDQPDGFLSFLLVAKKN